MATQLTCLRLVCLDVQAFYTAYRLGINEGGYEAAPQQNKPLEVGCSPRQLMEGLKMVLQLPREETQTQLSSQTMTSGI